MKSSQRPINILLQIQEALKYKRSIFTIIIEIEKLLPLSYLFQYMVPGAKQGT